MSRPSYCFTRLRPLLGCRRAAVLAGDRRPLADSVDGDAGRGVVGIAFHDLSQRVFARQFEDKQRSRVVGPWSSQDEDPLRTKLVQLFPMRRTRRQPLRVVVEDQLQDVHVASGCVEGEACGDTKQAFR